MIENSRSILILRRVIAILAGALVGIVLSIGTDEAMRAVGLFPPLDSRWPASFSPWPRPIAPFTPPQVHTSGRGSRQIVPCGTRCFLAIWRSLQIWWGLWRPGIAGLPSVRTGIRSLSLSWRCRHAGQAVDSELRSQVIAPNFGSCLIGTDCLICWQEKLDAERAAEPPACVVGFGPL